MAGHPDPPDTPDDKLDKLLRRWADSRRPSDDRMRHLQNRIVSQIADGPRTAGEGNERSDSRGPDA